MGPSRPTRCSVTSVTSMRSVNPTRTAERGPSNSGCLTCAASGTSVPTRLILGGRCDPHRQLLEPSRRTCPPGGVTPPRAPGTSTASAPIFRPAPTRPRTTPRLTTTAPRHTCPTAQLPGPSATVTRSPITPRSADSRHGIAPSGCAIPGCSSTEPHGSLTAAWHEACLFTGCPWRTPPLRCAIPAIPVA